MSDQQQATEVASDEECLQLWVATKSGQTKLIDKLCKRSDKRLGSLLSRCHKLAGRCQQSCTLQRSQLCAQAPHRWQPDADLPAARCSLGSPRHRCVRAHRKADQPCRCRS